MDKTWNRKYSQTIVNLSDHMKKAMPYLLVDISSCIERMEPQLHGNQSWHPQALVSLSCLYVCVRALAHSERLVHLSRPERQACGQYVLHKDKLSARCKTHVKAIQGSPAVFGKQEWDTMTSFVEEKKPATVTVDVAGAETEDSGIADLLETLTDICDALKDDCISWGTTTSLLVTSIK